jgi:transposase
MFRDGHEKKTLQASERKEADRKLWQEKAKELKREDLLFLDECGSNIALTRLYARAPKGKRVYGSVPRNRKKNTTLLASLSLSGVGETMLIEGAANAQIFELYIERILAPSLRKGQTVVMDNLSIHKGQKVRQLIEAQGCQLLFLPAYSPDFSPIEETFSKLKAILRRIGARTQEALQEAVASALLCITAADADGWFRHCGYTPAAAVSMS